jgi:hypothetical protein
MVALQDVQETHVINKPLTKEQVKDSILEGAKFSNWRVKDLNSSTLLATFNIRTHTVNVQIDYSESGYSLYYKSSNEMKMYCTRDDYVKKKGVIVSGNQDCPGGKPPYAIHGAYKTWVDDLNHDIQTSLESK